MAINTYAATLGRLWRYEVCLQVGIEFIRYNIILDEKHIHLSDTILYRISTHMLYPIREERVDTTTYLDPKLHRRITVKKQRLDKLRPLSPDTVKKLQAQMQITYTYHSNAIEGNTLTLRETQLVIEEGMTVRSKPLSEVLEAKNHPNAIHEIEKLAASNLPLTEEQILMLHRIVFRDSMKEAGQYRTGEVTILGSKWRPPPASHVPFAIREMFSEYNANPEEFVPIELSAWLLHHFVQIHPFTDGNGRIARLLMNLTLLKHGYPITVLTKADRKKYVRSLDRADDGDLKPLVSFVAASVEQSLDMYLRAVDQQTDERLQSLSEASKGTDFSAEYLSLLARTRRIPAIKIGRTWMVTNRMISEYQNQLTERKPKIENQ